MQNFNQTVACSATCIFETKFNKETYRMVTISTFTLYPLLLNAWTISKQYLTISFSSFSGEDF